MFRFDLKPRERVLQLHRQAEINLAGPALIVLILIYVPAAFLIKYDLFFDYKWIVLVWSFIVLAYFLNKYLLWLVNVHLVTSQRLVEVSYLNVLHKQVSEIPLPEVASVSFRRRGLFQNIFDLGDVLVKSAQGAEVTFKNIQHPSQLKDYLWALREKQGATTIVRSRSV